MSHCTSENRYYIVRQLDVPGGVWYGHQTWCFTLREERCLRVFENGVLRKIFGPKRDEVTVEWRKLHDEEIYEL